jgi:hypothetical protein
VTVPTVVPITLVSEDASVDEMIALALNPFW